MAPLSAFRRHALAVLCASRPGCPGEPLTARPGHPDEPRPRAPASPGRAPPRALAAHPPWGALAVRPGQRALATLALASESRPRACPIEPWPRSLRLSSLCVVEALAARPRRSPWPCEPYPARVRPGEPCASRRVSPDRAPAALALAGEHRPHARPGDPWPRSPWLARTGRAPAPATLAAPSRARPSCARLGRELLILEEKMCNCRCLGLEPATCF